MTNNDNNYVNPNIASDVIPISKKMNINDAITYDTKKEIKENKVIVDVIGSLIK